MFNKRILKFAATGFLAAALLAAYSDWYALNIPPEPIKWGNEPAPERPWDWSLTVAAIGFVICPPVLLTVELIDVEPRSFGFFYVWFFVALKNAILYGFLGLVVESLRNRMRPSISSP